MKQEVNYMKKILFGLVVFVLMSSFALAQGNGTGNQVQIQAGNYITPSGGQVQIQAQENNQFRLESGAVFAHTSMQMTQEQAGNGTTLRATLSNGRFAEIKIMPDVASEIALEQLRLRVCSEDNNCTLELKEVGQGEQVRAAYEVQVQKQARLFGLFKAKMQVQAQVDAETGEAIQTKKPWWAFLASESEESE
jgi:hypothetical protein